MLQCKDVADRASAIIDGELGMWEAFQVRMHLAMCKGCSRFIGQMRVTRDLTLSAAPAPADPADEDRIDALLSRLHDGTQRGD